MEHVLGIVFAGFVAGALAFFEIAAKFEGLHLVFRNGVWRFWLGRVALESAVAVLVLLLARATSVPHVETPWAGFVVGAATAAGLRSSFVDLGEQPLGFRTVTDPARAWFNERLKNRAAATGALWYANVLEIVCASEMTIEEIADHAKETLRRKGDRVAQVKASEQISDAVADQANSRRERVQLLLQIGMQAAGDDFADTLRKAAEARGVARRCAEVTAVGVLGDPAQPRHLPTTPAAPLRRPSFRLTPKRIALLAVGLVVFLAISGLLARFLSAENTERDADLALIEAEARGDVNAMLDQLHDCRADPACVASVKANAANPRLRRRGAVKILLLQSPTAYSLTGASGRTRLAWTVIGTLPVVQCVGVRRTGNFLSGIHVSLVSLSAPIPNEADC